MKNLIFTILISTILISPSFANTLKIKALVNGEIITNEDLSARTKIFMLHSPLPYNSDTARMIDNRVFVQTVEQKLKNQAIDKEGITISPKELDYQIQSWCHKNKTSLSALKNQGVSKDTVAELMKADLGWIKLIRKKYFQTSGLTQKEIDESIEDVTSDMSIKKYQVQEIFLKKENAAGIEGLVSKLRKDPRFELYAARFSDAPSASNGGNLGWINSGKMLSALEMRLSSMKPGEISDAILIGDGYYILKLLHVFDPKQNPDFTPDTAEIKRLLENEKMESISKQLLQDIKQKAIIELRP